MYLTPLFKSSVDPRVEALVSNWIIWKIGAVILFKRNMAEKDVCRAHTFRSLDCNFSFCTILGIPKGKKRINKALSKHSKQFLLLFYILV